MSRTLEKLKPLFDRDQWEIIKRIIDASYQQLERRLKQAGLLHAERDETDGMPK
jgi:hypothetical protein